MPYKNIGLKKPEGAAIMFKNVIINLIYGFYRVYNLWNY